MNLTAEELKLFGREQCDYAADLEAIARGGPSESFSGVEITCIGNSGGSANVVCGQPTGGFLLRRGGRCIMVDPGANSMARLARLGLDPFAITDVFATHTHNDHVGDLTLAVSAAINLGLDTDCDARIVVAPSLVDYAAAERTRFGFTLPSYAWKATVVSLFWEESPTTHFDGHPLQSVPETALPGGLTVRASEARHGGTLAMGFVIDTGAGRIGYTGDTEYFPTLAEPYLGVDLLWMNLNTLALDGMVPPPDGPGATGQTVHNHLGYVGACLLIDRVRPRTAIVSHLGVQLRDRRAEIEALLQARFAPLGIAVYCPRDGDRYSFPEGLSGPLTVTEAAP